MNCHRVVKAESPWIQQIKKHYDEKKPIEWVRVHRLPDHARFNHQAHVRKGLDCKACHGDVGQMEKVRQVGALSMGWCLQCHRGMDVSSSVLSAAKPGADPAHPGELAPYQCSTCHY
ncbi:MAG: cytochrome c3 family protein [Bdellovibrionales bacterium]|nr:cytochrome c3 family protein [Bdellovibrionales bacterium]